MSHNLQTPSHILLEVTKLKYKAALPAFVLIVISFLGAELYPRFDYRYLSLLGLIWFLVVLAIYRVEKNVFVEPGEVPVAPINGKVVSIDTQDKETIVTIKKTPFDKADVRLSVTGDRINLNGRKPLFENDKYDISWMVGGWKQYIFKETQNEKADIAGLIIGYGKCKYYLPPLFKVSVSVGSKTTAGETIMACYKGDES